VTIFIFSLGPIKLVKKGSNSRAKFALISLLSPMCLAKVKVANRRRSLQFNLVETKIDVEVELERNGADHVHLTMII